MGLYIHSPQNESVQEPIQPEDLWAFLHLALNNVFNAFQIASYQNNPVDSHRTIEINDCGVTAVDFDIKQGSEKYQQLYAAGQQAVYDFFGMNR